MHCLSASSFVLFAAPLAQAADTFAADAPWNGPQGSQAVADPGLGTGTPSDSTLLLAGGATAGTIGALGWNYKGTQAVNPQFQSGLQTLNFNFLEANGLVVKASEGITGTEATLKSQTEKFVFGKETKLHPERGIESLVEKYNAAKKTKSELKPPFHLLEYVEKSSDGSKVFKVKDLKDLETEDARTLFFKDNKKKYLVADELQWDIFASKEGFESKSFVLNAEEALELAKPGVELIEQGGEATRMWKMTPGIKNPWVAAAVGAAAVAGTIHLLSGIGNANRRLRGAV